jgi:sulfonate dioxygenase
MLKITETPSSGGDTLFISSTAAYDALSPAYKKIIDGLEAIHSNKHVHYHSIDGAGTERGLSDFYRRGPHSSVHPVVRTHPLTGWRSIFVNPGFTTQIKGFTAEESKSILKFLYEHLQSDQFKVRFRWENGSVALWDNRCSQHEAIWDYFPEVRKGVRVVASGERPYYDPKSKSRIEDLQGKGAVLSPAWVRSIL